MRSPSLVGQAGGWVAVIWPGLKSVPGPFVLKPVFHFKPLSAECGGYGSGHRHRNYFRGSRTANREFQLHNEAVGDVGRKKKSFPS